MGKKSKRPLDKNHQMSQAGAKDAKAACSPREQIGI